jgi:hypothetical protein
VNATAFVDLLNHRFNPVGYAYGIQPGRTYDRIWMAPILQGAAALTHRSIYCFVRKTDGAILKAASWQAPAKGVRSTVERAMAGADPVGPTSGWLYR